MSSREKTRPFQFHTFKARVTQSMQHITQDANLVQREKKDNNNRSIKHQQELNACAHFITFQITSISHHIVQDI